MKLPKWSTPNIDDYLLSCHREDREFLRQQDKDARERNAITCRCGFRRWIGFAFRCFYCGEWFCMACAEEHFGKTLHQWREEKRVQLRNEIEMRRAHDYSPSIPEAVACERLNRIASAMKSIKTHQDPLDQALNEGDGVYKP